MPWEQLQPETLTSSDPDELGPCASWVDPATLPCIPDGTDGTVYAAAASQLLWQWSGRVYDGACARIARPCGTTGCFAGVSVAAMRWSLSAWLPYTTTNRDDVPPLCGCVAYRQVPLAGYPVQTVDEVTIDGGVVDPVSYRLDDHRYLVRLDGAYWPSCQDMRVTAGLPGSFVVSYTAGIDPPAAGVLAASQLACYLYTAATAGECALPATTTAVARQGVSMNLTDALTGQARGLPLVAAFLDSVNPHRLTRRAAFWSPDVEPFAR